MHKFQIDSRLARHAIDALLIRTCHLLCQNEADKLRACTEVLGIFHIDDLASYVCFLQIMLHFYNGVSH